MFLWFGCWQFPIQLFAPRDKSRSANKRARCEGTRLIRPGIKYLFPCNLGKISFQNDIFPFSIFSLKITIFHRKELSSLQSFCFVLFCFVLFCFVFSSSASDVVLTVNLLFQDSDFASLLDDLCGLLCKWFSAFIISSINCNTYKNEQQIHVHAKIRKTLRQYLTQQMQIQSFSMGETNNFNLEKHWCQKRQVPCPCKNKKGHPL